MGLHSRCSSVTGTCTPFPNEETCAKDKYFCSMWRTVGFLISFDVVLELCTLVSFGVIIAGGVQRRVAGWSVICGLLLFSGIVQCAGMAIVVCFTVHTVRGGLGWSTAGSCTDIRHGTIERSVLTPLGIPLRPPRAILRRLVSRRLMVPRHRLMGPPHPNQPGDSRLSRVPPAGRRLRAYPGRAADRSHARRAVGAPNTNDT